MKTFGDSGRSFAAQPPGQSGHQDPRSRQLPSATAPTTRGAGVADERGRESEVDSGGGAEPRGRVGGQVEAGGTEVIEQPGEAAGADDGQTQGGLLYPGGPVTDRPIQSGPELMGGTSARQQARAVIEYGQAGLISPDRTALAAGGAIDKICDLALDHRRSFGC